MFQFTHPMRGATLMVWAFVIPFLNFDSRTSYKVRHCLFSYCLQFTDFDSRTLYGCDFEPSDKVVGNVISIHAPIQDATGMPEAILPFTIFRFTYPYRVRHQFTIHMGLQIDFNSRTRVECDVASCKSGRVSQDFNSRTRVECDLNCFKVTGLLVDFNSRTSYNVRQQIRPLKDQPDLLFPLLSPNSSAIASA